MTTSLGSSHRASQIDPPLIPIGFCAFSRSDLDRLRQTRGMSLAEQGSLRARFDIPTVCTFFGDRRPPRRVHARARGDGAVLSARRNSEVRVTYLS
jgi:hypothetical protein